MSAALKVISDICVGSKTLNREAILRYEEMVIELSKREPILCPQLVIPVTHHIHGGMYGREITIPKDTILTGQIYKFDHFDVMISGDITVSTDSGETKRFTGYNCFKGMSGKKRAGYAHEDTTWITFHPYTGKDGDSIQDFITADSFEELALFNTVINKADYESMINDMNTTEEEVRLQVENKNDLIEMPLGYEDIYIKDSGLEGRGVFSKKNISIDSVICPSRVRDKRTPAGRYTNHALQPNAKMIFKGKDMDLVSIKDIEANEEITVNYRDVINNRYIEGDLCQE